MSCVIRWDMGEHYEETDNITADVVMESCVVETDEFSYWLSENYDMTTDTFNETVHDPVYSEMIDEFRDSDAGYQLRDSCEPLMNYVHILSSEPTSEEVEFCYKVNPNVSIIRIDTLDVCAISLTGGGMYLGDCIELAYFICDGVAPDKASDILTVDRDTLMFCREKYEKDGYVPLREIKDFYYGGKDDKR